VRDLLEGLTDNPRFLIRDKFDPSIVRTVQESHLTDPAYWVSNEFSLALFENVHKVVQGPNPLFEAGIGAVREGFSKHILFVAKLFGPVAMGRQAEKINTRFNKTKHVRLVDSSEGSMIFELKYRPGFRVTKNVCHWNRGIYSGGVQLTGVTNVRAQETQCVVDGDDHCIFRITWDFAPWYKRLFTGLVNRFIRWTARELLEEYETTVHERDQLIENLIRSETKYRALFEDSPDGMSLTTGGKIVDVNPAWLKIHGYARKEDVLGKDVIDVIHPEDRFILSNRRKAWPAVDNRFYRLRDLRNDDTFLDVEVYSFQIVAGGDVSILTTVHDITELKQTEEAQRQLEARIQRAEKMEALGNLAGGVAHDLNNVLGVLVGYSELLTEKLPRDHPLRRYAENILASGMRGAAIIQDLLTLARRDVTVLEMVDLNDVVRDCLKTSEFESLQDRHLQIQFLIELGEDLLNIEGSPVHLRKVVMNLMSNAAESISGRGEVTIRTQNRYLDRPVRGYDTIFEGDYAVLTVSDTGKGISADDLGQIFEPFYTKKVMGRSGTGLGLAVVWGAVKDHRGYIDVQSEEGRGSTFTLYFPVTRRQAEKLEPGVSAVAYQGRGESLLVVDDVKEQRELAASMLERLGYRVEVASGGEEAVGFLRDRGFDLVVLDMIMEPGIDGMETYRRMLEIRPGQRAIIVSGFSETDRVRMAQELGAGAFVRKPYMMAKIGIAVRSELDRK
jgi:PAS domain S-box-containing protein